MKNTKLKNALSTVLILLIVLTALLLAGMRIAGLQPFIVLSPSMEPTYAAGSVIYVKTVDTNSLKVGDPITFYLTEDKVATHRIVEIVSGESESAAVFYRTKGDANRNADAEPVSSEAVIGVPVFSVPYLGFAANFIQRPAVSLLIVAACLAAVIDSFRQMRRRPSAEENSSSIF